MQMQTVFYEVLNKNIKTEQSSLSIDIPEVRQVLKKNFKKLNTAASLSFKLIDIPEFFKN